MNSLSFKKNNVGIASGASKVYVGTLVNDLGEMNYEGNVLYGGSLGCDESNMVFSNSSINVLNVSDNRYL